MDELRSPYDLIEVLIDEEVVRARPIKWDSEIADAAGNNDKGEPAKPTIYESTCPHCSQMIMFNAELKEIQCPECGVGKDVLLIPESPFRDPDIEPVQLDRDKIDVEEDYSDIDIDIEENQDDSDIDIEENQDDSDIDIEENQDDIDGVDGTEQLDDNSYDLLDEF